MADALLQPTHVLPRPPSKVVAVHLNYRSRAAERGRVPAHPSYFLKPPNTIAGSGDEVERPEGCELLAFEGEIALVVGRRARKVPLGEGWAHVGWVTAANDFGVQDLRYADAGSNVRSKGVDGYTPIGPVLLDAAALDPRRLHLRTWVDGELVQEATTEEDLLFDFDLLVADLSRLMTLEPGDVILTGTPAGSSVVVPGQVVDVEVSAAGGATTGRLRSPIVASPTPLATFGSMPRADDATRRLAYGSAGAHESSQPPELPDALGRVSTATLASQLRQRGLNGCTLDGVATLHPHLRLLGRARTVRYLPLREDLFAVRSPGLNAQKRAVDSLLPGEVLVIGARGERSAGTIGDLLVQRAQVRGAAGIVTDGAVRDQATIAALGLPVYCNGSHPAVLGRRHVPWDTDVAVDCGGVLVEPGDLLVGDADGVVVVPWAVAAEVAADAVEQERQERFIAERVAAGDDLDGLYPIGDRFRAAYDAWCEAEQG